MMILSHVGLSLCKLTRLRSMVVSDMMIVMTAVSEISSPNGVSPLLLYCAASLSAAQSAREPVDETMSVQCGRAALHEDRLDLLTLWITEDDRCALTSSSN